MAGEKRGTILGTPVFLGGLLGISTLYKGDLPYFSSDIGLLVDFDNLIGLNDSIDLGFRVHMAGSYFLSRSNRGDKKATIKTITQEGRDYKYIGSIRNPIYDISIAPQALIGMDISKQWRLLFGIGPTVSYTYGNASLDKKGIGTYKITLPQLEPDYNPTTEYVKIANVGISTMNPTPGDIDSFDNPNLFLAEKNGFFVRREYAEEASKVIEDEIRAKTIKGFDLPRLRLSHTVDPNASASFHQFNIGGSLNLSAIFTGFQSVIIGANIGYELETPVSYSSDLTPLILSPEGKILSEITAFQSSVERALVFKTVKGIEDAHKCAIYSDSKCTLPYSLYDSRTVQFLDRPEDLHVYVEDAGKALKELRYTFEDRIFKDLYEGFTQEGLKEDIEKFRSIARSLDQKNQDIKGVARLAERFYNEVSKANSDPYSHIRERKLKAIYEKYKQDMMVYTRFEDLSPIIRMTNNMIFYFDGNMQAIGLSLKEANAKVKNISVAIYDKHTPKTMADILKKDMFIVPVPLDDKSQKKQHIRFIEKIKELSGGNAVLQNISGKYPLSYVRHRFSVSFVAGFNL